MKLPSADQIRARLRPVFRPQSKLGRTTLWFGVVAGAAQIVQMIMRPAPGTMLSGWAQFLSFLFLVCLFLLAFRWVRRRLMWRLRNRLVVTYIFIGVIPILLLVSMGLLAGYLFAGQFATYIALSDLQKELEHLQSANNALTRQFRSLSGNNSLTPQLAAEIASASDENFRQRMVTVLEGDKGYVISPGGRIQEVQMKLPEAIKGDISSFTMDQGRLNLRAMKQAEAGAGTWSSQRAGEFACFSGPRPWLAQSTFTRRSRVASNSRLTNVRAEQRMAKALSIWAARVPQ